MQNRQNSGFLKIVIIIVIFVSSIGILLYTSHRKFVPVSYLVEDTNSISPYMLDHFNNLWIKMPQNLTKVYEYDGRQLFSDAFLRFTIPDSNEYNTFKSGLLNELTPDTALFPTNYDRRDIEKIEHWWTPPLKNTYKIGNYYLGFDDDNVTIFLLYDCPG